MWHSRARVLEYSVLLLLSSPTTTKSGKLRSHVTLLQSPLSLIEGNVISVRHRWRPKQLVICFEVVVSKRGACWVHFHRLHKGKASRWEAGVGDLMGWYGLLWGGLNTFVLNTWRIKIMKKLYPYWDPTAKKDLSHSRNSSCLCLVQGLWHMQPFVLLALRLNSPYSFPLIRLLPPCHFFLSRIHVLYDPLVLPVCAWVQGHLLEHYFKDHISGENWLSLTQQPSVANSFST